MMLPLCSWNCNKMSSADFAEGKSLEPLIDIVGLAILCFQEIQNLGEDCQTGYVDVRSKCGKSGVFIPKCFHNQIEWLSSMRRNFVVRDRAAADLIC